MTEQLNHPYLREYLEVPLQMHKLKLECLQKKLSLMPEGKTDYERNEVVLEKIKTQGTDLWRITLSLLTIRQVAVEQ